MGIALSTIGIEILYAVETTAGEMPATGFAGLPDLKSIPSLNPAPNTADASTFDNKEYTTSVPLLKDLGGTLEITANLTQELFDTWESMVDAYETAKSEGLGLWFRVDIPGFDHSAYIPVEPSRMGMPEMGANSLLETSVYVTPIGEPVWVSNTDENSLLNP